MNDSDTFFDCLSALTQQSDCYRGQWICDKSLAMILHRHYPKIEDKDTLRLKLVMRLNKAAGAFNGSNVNKMYKSQFKTVCPLSSKRRKVYFYIFWNGQRIPKEPKTATYRCVLHRSTAEDVKCTEESIFYLTVRQMMSIGDHATIVVRRR